jgi:hypothetical protein
MTEIEKLKRENSILRETLVKIAGENIGPIADAARQVLEYCDGFSVGVDIAKVLKAEHDHGSRQDNNSPVEGHVSQL